MSSFNSTALALHDADSASSLISRLQDEADLCRNEGADDIAGLLDEAAKALTTKPNPVHVQMLEALKLLDQRLRECSVYPIDARDAYDSFYQGVVHDAIAAAGEQA